MLTTLSEAVLGGRSTSQRLLWGRRPCMSCRSTPQRSKATIHRWSGSPAATEGDRVEFDGLVRVGARVVAGLRVVLGVTALVSPEIAARPWVGWSAGDPAGSVLG